LSLNAQDSDVDTEKLTVAILNAVEEKETELLVWGDASGYFSEDELETLIKGIIEEHADEFVDALDDEFVCDLIEELIEELLAGAMLFEVNQPGEPTAYRSRMTSAVYLYSNLRQWFHGKKIEESKTLISDFRFLRKPRYYPDRNTPLPELLSEWSASGLASQVQLQALESLIGHFKLSGFQARATEDILKKIPSSRRWKSTATIVCAGTGSGKTNAFYWPALAHITSDILAMSEARVRALAIYPRIELLKDQFNEAWLQCRKLDTVMASNGGRKIRIGALFGDTIKSLANAQYADKDFHSFDYLKCATPNCRGEMRWGRLDIDRGIERLECNQCGFEVTSEEVSLTRESMKKWPPDILFTTTESLNQKMSESYYRHLFGIRSKHPIPLVLLDEVHTYSGESGVNVAFLLRRYMKMAKMSPHFVGLSATLIDAEVFFARLTGSEEYNTQLIEPITEEMIEEGSEYLLALRGDAVSQTALLSTTIQAAMLAARLQDPLIKRKSKGNWGAKTFIFCDNLDIVNRLYYQLYDAEGWKLVNGRLSQKRVDSLVTLRNPNNGHKSSRILDRYGQDWSVAIGIGHKLDANDRARVARTSGQDGGVDNDAQLIVATSKLEVGFNDPDVGTVIQYKAPRNVASYLQRKGRAGRARKMRPWTIVTLSEFGKDRTAFQNYERLLDPEIKSLVLPIENDHVLRMQAAMATLEWLGTVDDTFSPWKDLNKPKGLASSKKQKLLRALYGVLNGGHEREKLREYISRALVIEGKVVDGLLWRPPRSIYNAVIPTIIRKLETDWGRWNSGDNNIQEWAEAPADWGSPLAEFIPSQLFSRLTAPDLQIMLERASGRKQESMPYFLGLKEFAPGRISKRYSITRGDYSDWVFPAEIKPSPDLHGCQVGLEIGDVFGANSSLIERIYSSELGSFIDIFRPSEVFTSSLPPQLQMTEKSNAILRWHAEYKANQAPRAHEIPAESYWEQDIFRSISFYTHETMTPLQILRFNTGSNATLNFKNGQQADVCVDWKHNDVPVGVGTTLSVDAACMEFACSPADVATRILDKPLLRSLRYGYLKDRLENCAVFNGNAFNANWVHECFITAIALEVAQTNVGTTDAIAAVCGNRSIFSLEDTKDMLFQDDFELSDGDPENDEDAAEQRKEQKLQADLRVLFGNSEVIAVLKEFGTELFGSLDQNTEFIEWCRHVIAHTLAAAAQQTLCTLFPHVSDQDLCADIKMGDTSIIVWLSEKEEGGGGIITEFERKYFDDTLGVLNTFARTMQVGTYEQLDVDLTALLEKRFSNIPIDSAFDKVRKANNYTERLTSIKSLRSVVVESGFDFSHSFSAVLFSRILKANSSQRTDEILLKHLKRWAELEEKVELELPINITAAVIAATEGPPNIFKRACEIQSVMWPRGSDVRQEALPFYNPFHQATKQRTERLLAAKMCQDRTTEVIYLSDDWDTRLYAALEEFARVDLMVNRNFINDVSNIVTKINVTPLDTYGLLLYPRIASMRRELNNIRVRVELSEFVH
jgi:ATP-dependent Lhr-like helicase